MFALLYLLWMNGLLFFGYTKGYFGPNRSAKSPDARPESANNSVNQPSTLWYTILVRNIDDEVDELRTNLQLICLVDSFRSNKRQVQDSSTWTTIFHSYSTHRHLSNPSLDFALSLVPKSSFFRRRQSRRYPSLLEAFTPASWLFELIPIVYRNRSWKRITAFIPKTTPVIGTTVTN